ncbi:MAG: hybrid sensor histidine kinase/response regulator [Gloeocapsa sp. DLM2.Bin57]|nr:MAG: hybrid sensor histidine kinase/response regulator [Gloeocapsa sp. DLM2.Bin57]
MSYYQEQQIRQQFLEEAEEYIKNIELGLLGIANQPLTGDRLETIRRASHSLKGGAALMNYPTLSELSHQLENCFNFWQPGYICESVATEQLLLETIDCLKYCVNEYRQGVETIDPNWITQVAEPLFNQVQEELGYTSGEDSLAILEVSSGEDIRVLMFTTEVEGCLQRLETVINSEDKTCLREEFTLVAQELGGLGEMLELREFQSLCLAIEQALNQATAENLLEISELALQQWRYAQSLVVNQQFSLIPTNLPELDSQPLITEATLVTTTTDDSPSPTITPPPPPTTPSEHNLRVSAEKLAQLEDLFGELIIERNGLNLQLQQLTSLMGLLKQRVNNLDQANRSLRIIYDQTAKIRQPQNSQIYADISDSWDSLEFDRYTEIHPLFQDLMEIIVQIQEVTGDIETNLDLTEKAAKGISRTSELLQNNLTQVRLRPFADLVRLFPRAIREMTIKYGKDVNLVVTGESTLIDRTILDLLNDPLIHLLRNAFDHGIEDTQKRIDLGKNPTGTITIDARQRGNLIIITIQDDGQGINIAKIRQKIGNSPQQNLSNEKLIDLIFEPGFSTASQVTELSGRGLGMDIVRRELQKIRGQIQVNSEPGQGTTFTIIVPFTLSVVKVLLLESGKMLLAIPVSVVEEMLVITPDMRIETAGQHLLNWDGEIIPLLSLAPWLNFNRLSPESPGDGSPIINQPIVLMIAQGNRLFALEMERYWGEQEVTVRTLEGVIPLPTGLIGCTILGNGRVVPIADPLALINWLETDHSAVNLTTSVDSFSDTETLLINQTTTAKKTIMVVDDSINVRRFLALTLEKVGYKVEQAKDGQEALEKLATNHIDIVICDIEMPRLDGYAFLSQVRSHPEYKSLPVIMLTSRSGEKHRQTAMSLGATDYFSKPFQEQVLLATLKSYE